MKFMRIRSDVDPVITDWGPSLTDQSQGPDTDVNNIMKKFKLNYNGMPDPRDIRRYMDVSQIPRDLTGIYDMVNHANETFAQIPSDIREYFENSPENMISFLSDPSNREKAIELGLIPKTESVAQSEQPVTPSKPAQSAKKGKPAETQTTTTNDDE